MANCEAMSSNSRADTATAKLLVDREEVAGVELKYADSDVRLVPIL